jgi:hypothetical protein
MEAFARLILGLVAASLVVSLIQNGPDGPRKWMAAKFLGKTS